MTCGAVVPKDKWMNFYYDIEAFRMPDLTNKIMLERYGVVYWKKVDLDNIRITFTEEKKMTYWLLKWL